MNKTCVDIKYILLGDRNQYERASYSMILIISQSGRWKTSEMVKISVVMEIE